MSKGELGGECNRTVCNNTGAIYFNYSTEKHYCEECAEIINRVNRTDSQRIFGHDLCLPCCGD